LLREAALRSGKVRNLSSRRVEDSKDEGIERMGIKKYKTDVTGKKVSNLL